MSYSGYNYQKDVVALIKDKNEAVIGYKLSDGEILSKEEAIKRAAEGEINDVVIGTSKNGDQYLHGIPEATGGIDLESLPIIDDNSLR
ncbi:DUF3892 domain-containing protein [Clostridium oceanicum]|uniref:DUF3892 domain-containing protein n=1 Tax=Clostridium oceanicum TaxID=1543 RepID=A0ABP3UT62_9CLOT